MSFYAATDPSVLEELGRRLRQRRLDRNLSQQEIAEKAGLDRTTVGALERDGRGTLLTVVQVLRALSALDELDGFLPATGPSPLELARRQGRVRRRASSPRGPRGAGGRGADDDQDPEPGAI